MNILSTIKEVALARTFALAAHKEQKYGIHPYSYHLDRVVALLVPYGGEAQVVGYLHDVLEDTPTAPTEIATLFGEDILKWVQLVTDEQGFNRKERKQKTNKKLASVTTADAIALVVKAADRLANVRQCLVEIAEGASTSKLQMYQREQEAFKQAVYRPALCQSLWDELEQILTEGSK